MSNPRLQEEKSSHLDDEPQVTLRLREEETVTKSQEWLAHDSEEIFVMNLNLNNIPWEDSSVSDGMAVADWGVFMSSKPPEPAAPSRGFGPLIGPWVAGRGVTCSAGSGIGKSSSAGPIRERLR
jgi:hypothetical protein